MRLTLFYGILLKQDSSANNLAIMEKALFWVANLQVFWQSETIKWLLALGKQWLLAAILRFYDSWLQDNCRAEGETANDIP